MIISPDHFLMESDGTYNWSRTRVDSAWRMTLDRVRAHLPYYREIVLLVGVPGAGKSTWLSQHQEWDVLYVDAVFSAPNHRKPFLDLAQAAHKPIRACWIDTDLSICRERNSLRPVDRRIPDDKIGFFHLNLRETPPTEEEGFTSVIRIRS